MNDSATDRTPGENRQAVEPSDVPVRPVLIGVGIVTGVLVVAVAALWWFYGSVLSGRAADNPIAPRHKLGEMAPDPQLQVNPAWDLEKLTAAKRAWLNTTGWRDRQAGVVRIPIRQAMERYVGSGWSAMADYPHLDRALAERLPDRAMEGGAATAPVGQGAGGDPQAADRSGGGRQSASPRSPMMQKPATIRERVRAGFQERQSGELPPAAEVTP